MSRAGSPRTIWGGTRMASASNNRDVKQTVLTWLGHTAGALEPIQIAGPPGQLGLVPRAGDWTY